MSLKNNNNVDEIYDTIMAHKCFFSQFNESNDICINLLFVCTRFKQFNHINEYNIDQYN